MTADTTRITGLPEASHSVSGDFMAIDKAGGTARKLSVASLRAEAAADATNAVSAITAAAQSATAQALDAKNAANAAATAANTATTAANTAVTRANAAAEAAEGVILDSIPTMSTSVKGGAKAGDGLSVDNTVLSLGPLVKSGNPVDGCALYEVTGEGWSEQVQTVGKNLLPSTLAALQAANTSGTWSGNVYSKDGVTYTVNQDDSITVDTGSGTASANTRLYFFVGNSIGASANTTYTLSGCPSGGSSTTFDIRVTDNVTAAFADTGGGISFSYAYVTYLEAYIMVRSGASVSKKTFYPMLEAGDHETSWEPYSGGVPGPNPSYPFPIEVCRGRNLLVGVEQGSIGAGGANSASNNRARSIGYVPVTAGSAYALSGSHASGAALYASVLWYPDNSGGAKISNTDYAVLPFSATSPEGAAYARVAYKLASDTAITASDIKSPQIELGSQATPYVPYGHVGIDIYDSQSQHVATVPIPLPLKSDGTRWAGAVGDYADSLAIDSAGGYAWTCEMKERVFDGTESWNIEQSNQRVMTRLADNAAKLASDTDIQSALCSHFIPVSAASTFAGTKGVSTNASGTWAHFADGTGAMVVEDWKTWLSTHNVTLLYPLATPTTESGYVTLPMLPNGCTVTCPELSQVGVKWYVEGCRPIIEHAANERRYIESLISELATQ